MALNIPMPQLPLSGLNQAIATGGNLFQQMMHPKIQREDMARQWRQHLDSLAMQQAAQGRLAQAAQDAHKLAQFNIAKAEREADPAKQLAYIQQLLHGVQGSQQAPQQPMTMFGGGGMPSTEELENPTVTAPSQESLQQGFSLANLTPEQRMTLGMAGIKLPKEEVFKGDARNALDLERLKQQKGEESSVYQNAKAAYDASNDAKKDLRDLRARTKAGLKPGEKEFFDETSGEPLGKEIPLTEKERASEEGNILFNEFYPYVYKGAAPFSGEGSIGRLQQAAANYKTDPKARKMFDDFLLSEKMLAATTVNEAATLKSGHQNKTYGMLKESLDAQDIPKVVKKLIKEYGVPPSAQLHAAMRYQKILSDARKKGKSGIPATQKLFYNPEMQAQYEAKKEDGSVSNDIGTVIVIDPTGKRFETTAENAAHLPEGWTRG